MMDMRPVRQLFRTARMLSQTGLIPRLPLALSSLAVLELSLNAAATTSSAMLKATTSLAKMLLSMIANQACGYPPALTRPTTRITKMMKRRRTALMRVR
jgi:hypothetical protein